MENEGVRLVLSAFFFPESVLHGCDSTVLLIAHRGVSARAPENSLAAFRLALDEGVDGIETDVRLTRDGAAVLSHDDELTGGERISMTVAASLHLATLEELLLIAAGKTSLYLELKMWRDGDVLHSAARVAEAIAPLLGDIERVTMSSFDPAAVSAARALLPSVASALGVLEGADPTWAIDAAAVAGHQELHVHHSVIEETFVGRAHTAGLRVLAYTVNDPVRARALASIGTDGVFTDDPPALRAAMS